MIKCPNCKDANNLVALGTHYICLNCPGERFSIGEVEKELIDFLNEVKGD